MCGLHATLRVRAKSKKRAPIRVDRGALRFYIDGRLDGRKSYLIMPAKA